MEENNVISGDKMSYFNEETEFKITNNIAKILKDFVYKEEDTIFYYDMPLMFLLSSEKHKDIKFLVYMFSSIDDEILKYYILEKTNEEVEQYFAQKIDLKAFLRTDLHNKICCVEKISSEKIEVVQLEESDILNTLSLLKDDLFYRG